ncbi:MAG TPA: twin-arginine translocase subunit TatC [Longimicrobiales bacterium]|nr:twin-arginine translocase subunit TatC [Longimicrobiales bacterium]
MTRHRNFRGEMPFLDHLEELRWRIFWSVLAVAVCAAIGFAIVHYFDVLDLLIKPIRDSRDDPGFRLIYLSPADPFMIQLKLGIALGVVLALPVVIYHVWSFLSPALEKKEKRAIIPALYLGMVLFMGGVAMGYFAALPVTLQFFTYFEGDALSSQLEVGATLSMVTKMLLAFGAVFELPVVVMVLTALGLVTPEFLRSKRRHNAVAMTALASFITPGDVITLTVMMLVPLLLLYELSIFLSAAIIRRRNTADDEDTERTIRAPEGSVEVG